MAPEERASVAANKATALNKAKDFLHVARLREEAEFLEQRGTNLAKEATTVPERGQRLDACRGLVKRAEKRFEVSREGLKAAAATLAEAETHQVALEEELQASQERLKSLRGELAGGGKASAA